MKAIDGLHRVTGDVTPDCTGDYLRHVVWETRMSYRRTDGSYFIWWDGNMNWYISPAPGQTTGGVWFRHDENIEGEYLWGEGATGNATVTEI